MNLTRFLLRPVVRWSLVAAAIGGLFAGAVPIWQRASTRRARALYHAARAAEAREFLANWRQGGGPPANMGPDEAAAAAGRHAKLATYHNAMRRKWEDATYRPWLAVPTDPHNAQVTREKLR